MKHLLYGGLIMAALVGCGQNSSPLPPSPPVAVDTVLVQLRILNLTAELPGRIEPVRVAEVRARVAGIVLRRHFKEGADVKAGDTLFAIDPAPFKVALARAQADVAKSEALVQETQAVFRRYEPLVKMDAVSQQDFDASKSALASAIASRAAARADVQNAELNLQYATVKAPISGRIGRALVTEGALVGQNETTAMATIQQLDPIYADFTQPAVDAVRMREAIIAGTLASGGKAADTSIRLSLKGSTKEREGRLLFSDIAVDRTSGQVVLRGQFSNADGLLLPGMYVRVTAGQGTDPQAILIPQRALGKSTDGKKQVLVLGKAGVVEERLVQTGAMYGADWHIVSGLKAGDKVIVGRSTAKPGDKAVEAVPIKDS